MKAFVVKVRRTLFCMILVLVIGLPFSALSDIITNLFVVFGFTNVPIGEAVLEIIEGGVLFVHNTDAGAGVSVQLGEADSGIFLYPLMGYVYGGDSMHVCAYGWVNGTNDQFISLVSGVHNGDSSGTVMVDFSSLGAMSVSVFVGETLLGHIDVSNIAVRVVSDG